MPVFESFSNGGIIVARQIMDPELIAGLVSDGNHVIDAGSPYFLSTGQGSPSAVESSVRSYDAALQRHSGLSNVTDFILGSNASAARIVINRQHPFSFQRFHPDPTTLPIAVAHGNDGGAFDFIEAGVTVASYDVCDDSGISTQYKPASFTTIELNAGDVLLHIDTTLLHRGRNLGAENRITAAIYTS